MFDHHQRKRGRPRKALREQLHTEPLPIPMPSPWMTPEETAQRGKMSEQSLWKGVAAGIITPPAYPRPKCPRFHRDVFDADLARTRMKPSENEALRRTVELRNKARAARADAELQSEIPVE